MRLNPCMSTPKRILVLAGLVLGVGLAGSAAASTSPPTLRADVAEWSIVPSAGLLRAGTVQLVVHNYGLLPHQVLVARTARFGAPLPVRDGRAVVRPLAAPVLVRPGETKRVDVRLRAGSYLLLDNLRRHYADGTWTAIAVR